MKKQFAAILGAVQLCCFSSLMALAQTGNPNSPKLEEAANLNVQVVKLFREGKYDEALPIAKRALESRERELGREHQLVATSLFNLAMIYKAIGKYAAAEPLFSRALKIKEKGVGKEHPELYELSLELAWTHHALGHAGDAELLLKRAVAIKEKQLGPEHQDVVNPLTNLAAFYQKIGKPSNAIPQYQRAIAIQEKLFGTEAPQLADTLNHCVCALRQDKKFTEASSMEERIVKIEKAARPNSVRVSGGVLQGYATHREQPIYPVAAKEARLSGSVFVQVDIDEDGNVIEAKILCGPDLLAIVSRDAALKWQFAPTMLEGKAVKVRGVLTFNFTLQ